MNKGKCSTTHCPECEATSLSRNNYFTGKLLVERDFTDEQHYFREKIRLHHQRLHGAGVVCGLRILPHENVDCRDRYVLLEPGSAIDCCGQDILVAEPETIDLHAFPELKKLIDEADGQEEHTLQFCIRYRECGAEEIPVLYDDCSCDDNSSAPNRILESYEIELIIDPEADSEPGDVPDEESTDEDCQAILCEPHPCPSCDTADCLVLATVSNWLPGDKLEKMDDNIPPDGTAWINNRLDRKVLPSTQDIADALKCVIDNCCGDGGGGGTGPQGPQGEPGLPGPQGEPGVGLDPDYPHICAINWTHADGMNESELKENGLIIAFDSLVKNSDLDEISIRILMKTVPPDSRATCWCDVPIRITGLLLNSRCHIEKGINEEHEPNQDVDVDGVRIRLENLPSSNSQNQPKFRVIVNGDLIRGKHRIKTDALVGLDADYLPPWLSSPASTPDGPPGLPIPGAITGDGVEGGTFESWFTLKSGNSLNDLDLFNNADWEEITAVLGSTGVAKRIFKERPFSTWREVGEVVGIGDARLKQLKTHFTADEGVG